MAHGHPRIVLVDPDEITRLVIAEALAGESYEVFSATGYEEALRLVSRHKPAAIVTDSITPDGAEWNSEKTLLKRLKQLHPDIPVIAIPGSGGAKKPMLAEGAVWAEDKFYIQQGFDGSSQDPETHEISKEFLSQVALALQQGKQL